MVTLTLNTLYSYLQRSLLFKSSALSIASFLLHAHRKLALTPKKQTDEKIKSILYPGRITLVSTDTFFSNPKAIIQQKINHVEQIKQQSHCGKITPHYMAPREPIVLCHGLFGFDIRGPQNIPALQFHYWSGVEETLAKLGAKVIVTRVPQAGSIWERSHALHTILKSILVGKNVNFVAHSMGGLDCRHLLANTQDRPYHVQSLTTICTPHRGSPVMDWVRDHVGVGLSQSHNGLHQNSNWSPATTTISTKNNTLRHDADCLSSTTNTTNSQKWGGPKFPTLRPAIDKLVVNWFDEPAYAHLTTDFCNDYFNPNTPDDPSVKYYSYGAAAQLPAWSSLLGLPWRMVQEKEGDNDGFVSVNSAKWGTYVKTINADHWDLSGKSHIPYRLRTSGQEFDRLDFYAEMATHLYNQGH